MKSTKEEIAGHLAEARSIINLAERERQVFKPEERARAEYVLERVKTLKDGEQLRKAVADMNGSLNKAAGGGVGDFAQAVCCGRFSPQEQSLRHYPAADGSAEGPTLPGVGDWNRADPSNPSRAI
jgi:hypothetical protein